MPLPHPSQPPSGFAFNTQPTGFPSTGIHINPQIPSKHAQHKPPTTNLVSGQSDLEILQKLKDTIKAGQHEFYRAIPQPAALASMYLGSNLNSGQLDQQDSHTRPPRLQKEWDAGARKPSDTHKTTSAGNESSLPPKPDFKPSTLNGSLSSTSPHATVANDFRDRAHSISNSRSLAASDTNPVLDSERAWSTRDEVERERRRDYDSANGSRGSMGPPPPISDRDRDNGRPLSPTRYERDRDSNSYSYDRDRDRERDREYWDRNRDRDRDSREPYPSSIASNAPSSDATARYRDDRDRDHRMAEPDTTSPIGGARDRDFNDSYANRDSREARRPAPYLSASQRHYEPNHDGANYRPRYDAYPPLEERERDRDRSRYDDRERDRDPLPRAYSRERERSRDRGAMSPRDRERGRSPPSERRRLEDRISSIPPSGGPNGSGNAATTPSLQERLAAPAAAQNEVSTKSLEERLSTPALASPTAPGTKEGVPTAPVTPASSPSKPSKSSVLAPGSGSIVPPPLLTTSASGEAQASPKTANPPVKPVGNAATLPSTRPTPSTYPPRGSSLDRDRDRDKRGTSPIARPLNDTSREREPRNYRSSFGQDDYRDRYDRDHEIDRDRERDRNRDRMDVDPPLHTTSTYRPPTSATYNRPPIKERDYGNFSPPSAADLARDRDRMRNMRFMNTTPPPHLPSSSHAPRSQSVADSMRNTGRYDSEERRYHQSAGSGRDWAPNNTYDRERDRDRDRSQPPSRRAEYGTGAPEDTRSTWDRDRDRSSGWETKEERDRRNTYSYDRDRDPPSSTTRRVPDYPVQSPDDRIYPRGDNRDARDIDTRRYTPTAPITSAGADSYSSRIRPRSPSPARTVKRVRDDAYASSTQTTTPAAPYSYNRDPRDTLPPPRRVPDYPVGGTRQSPPPSGTATGYYNSERDRDYRDRERDRGYQSGTLPASYDRPRSPARSTYEAPQSRASFPPARYLPARS